MDDQPRQMTPLGMGLLALIVIGFSWVGWRASQGQGEMDTLEHIRRTGVVRIGYANEAPYGYLDSETGRITGEAPEIAREILTRMGAHTIEPVVTEFGSLIPGLQAGRFDVIAAGMYITPERADEIDFSHPTYAIGEAFLVRQGNPLDLHSFEDVAESKTARLGVMGGSVEHGYAKNLGMPEDRILIFPDYASAIEGLRTERVDAVAATVLTANRLLEKLKTPDIETAEPFSDPIIDGKTTRGYGAFGFRPSDDAFRQEFNRQLEKFLGTEEHLTLVDPFGFNKATLPDKKTAEEVIHSQTE